MATQTHVISGTDFITVATQDYERAAGFYGETLGLEFSKRWGSMPAGEFETGNLTIALMQSDAFGIEFVPSSAMVCLISEASVSVRMRLIVRPVRSRVEPPAKMRRTVLSLNSRLKTRGDLLGMRPPLENCP